jgi:hypothetical protein
MNSKGRLMHQFVAGFYLSTHAKLLAAAIRGATSSLESFQKVEVILSIIKCSTMLRVTEFILVVLPCRRQANYCSNRGLPAGFGTEPGRLVLH